MPKCPNAGSALISRRARQVEQCCEDGWSSAQTLVREFRTLTVAAQLCSIREFNSCRARWSSAATTAAAWRSAAGESETEFRIHVPYPSN